MHTESVQILLNNASAYAVLAQSLRDSGIDSWVSYHRQMLKCLKQAKQIQADQFELAGFEEEILLVA